MPNYKTDDDLGTEAGESCMRGQLTDCEGIIEVLHGMDCGCYCHMGGAPCSYCTSTYYTCPVCDWDEREEPGYQAP